MSDSNAPTRNDPNAVPERHLDTAGWVPPAAVKEIDARSQTAALPNLSTPGPNHPDRATRPESTENMLEPRPVRTKLPKLPPIPGYVVEQYIGRGGMGVVYRAKHAATGRTVALKLTNPGGPNDDTTRERFVREVHALAAIKHPNIVPVYDAGDWHGFPYCTMEFVPGGTLNQHLDRIRLDLRASVQLMVKVSRAIEALHAAGILHRDLKPLNILIGPNDEPMVADFGLARWIGDASDLTMTGLPVGTRQYMSPEQTMGNKTAYTAACDVWALGVTLYELLTGHRPFNDNGSSDVYQCIRTAAPPPMTALSPDVPEALQAIVSKCLAKLPADRYPTAAAFADDLDRWLRGEDVSVTTEATMPLLTLAAPSTVEPPRRRRGFTVAGGLVATVVVAAGLFGILRDRNPKVDTKPQKSISQRFAESGKVILTDDNGRPLVPVVNEPGHELQPGTLDGYYALGLKGTGRASLSDEPLEFPYRVEADVAVEWETSALTVGGIYAGGRLWSSPGHKHETFGWVGIRPTLLEKENQKRQERSLNASFWRDGSQRNVTTVFRDDSTPWLRNDAINFVHVVIDVTSDSIKASVDNRPLADRPEANVAAALNNFLASDPLPDARDYKFTAPYFGSGIGIYCNDAKCVVRNLTVSRPDK